MAQMGENEFTNWILRGIYCFGLVLHILSLACRTYLVAYGPIQLMALAPYTLVELLFIYGSFIHLLKTSRSKPSIWMKAFSSVNTVTILFLFILSFCFCVIADYGLEKEMESVRTLQKLLCLVFLTGPLITNSAFLGYSYLSNSYEQQVISLAQSIQKSEKNSKRRISDSDVCSRSTDA